MSTLKMVLDGEKKNLSKSQKFPRKVSVAEFRHSQTIFFAVPSNFTYDSEAYDLMKHYLKTSHSGSNKCSGAFLWKTY